MAGYVRQSSFTEGDIIRDTDHNAEYDAIAQTYDAQGGHKHDGTPNEGPVIPLIGDTGTTSPRNKVEVDSQNNKIKVYVQDGGFSVEQVSFGEGVILPATDNYLDLGTPGYKFKDAYVYNLYAQNIDGFEIGVDVQPYSGVLSTLSGVAPSANTLPYFTGPNAASVTSLSSFGRSLIDDSNAGAARTTLGATTVGSNLFTLTNPSAVRFLRVNADNSVSALTAAAFRSAIGAGAGGGSVTSVEGTGSVNGITLTGTVTTSGSLTLGGTLSGINIDTQTTGTLPVNRGGTGTTSLDSFVRTNQIGVSVQAYHQNLAALAGVGGAANRAPYFTGASAMSWMTVTPTARTLLDDDSLSDMRTTLGLGDLATASSVNNANWSGTALSIANGGTGSTTASAARTALGLETVSKAEAETGTSTTTRAWTAQRVAQAIAAQASPGADVQEFTASGTWNKPAGATFVLVELWGAGGGGGSGSAVVGGGAFTSGAGGGGGRYVSKLYKISDLPSSVSVAIGQGGAGGWGNANSSPSGSVLPGQPGEDGGYTSFGSLLRAYGGGGGTSGVGGGKAGDLSSGNGSTDGSPSDTGILYSAKGGDQGQAGGVSLLGGAGGGGGGSMALVQGSDGGSQTNLALAGGGGLGSTSPGVPGSPGAAFQGGGGGYSKATPSDTHNEGTNGGSGGLASGGGGGGSARTGIGFTAWGGTGGRGGDGYARITSW